MTTKLYKKRPNKTTTAVLNIIFIIHYATSILILLQFNNLNQIQLYIVNLSLILIPFIIVYFIVTFNFIILSIIKDENPPNPSTPFVILIFCLTSGELDLQNNTVEEFCIDISDHLIIRIFNCFITAILCQGNDIVSR